MNVLFKLSEREKGFENEIAVKYFFTNTLINSNRGYFHVGRKMIQLNKNDDIYFTYKGNIISKATYTGDFEENNEDEFPYGYKVLNIAIAKEYQNLSNAFPKYFRGQAAARYIDNDDKLQQYLNTIFDEKLFINESEKNDMPNIPLNQILYGPPGTGKTYNTINKAIEIVDNAFYQLHKEETPENRKALKEKFEEYKKAGQIEFITFHQSYGYEEFVEGIKAETTEKENVRYEVKAGTFKKLTKKAINNYNSSKKTTQQLIQEKTLQQKLDIFLNDCLDEQTEFSKTKGGKFKIQELNQDEVILFTEDSNYNDKILRLQRDELFKILDANIELNTSRQIAKDVFGISNQRQKDTYYFSICKEFNKTKFENLEKVSSEEPLKNHILIIDEINRGNISKIFGELITLIEPSKRIGEDEEMRVKLSYSGEDSEAFGVPSNLYIIGTMNTADRSIAQIDTALRRRFVFEEMMPKPELLRNIVLEDTNINIEKILEAINERIEYIYDREHTIGHSYFLPLLKTPTKEKLDEIFRVNIIPLLAEYFYGDWADIEFILNNNFIQEKKKKEYIKENSRQFNRVYEVNDTFEKTEYIKIYNGDSEEL